MVACLNQVFGQGQVCSVDVKVKVVVQFPTQLNYKKELVQFLGMVSYYQGFCKNISLFAPLTDLWKCCLRGLLSLKVPLITLNPFLDLRGQYYFRRGILSNRPLITSVIRLLVFVFEFIIADLQPFALLENTLHVGVGNPWCFACCAMVMKRQFTCGSFYFKIVSCHTYAFSHCYKSRGQYTSRLYQQFWYAQFLVAFGLTVDCYTSFSE